MVHDQAIIGVEPEGKLKVTYDYQDFTFPDGKKNQLAKPNYTITEWYADSFAPEAFSAPSAYRSDTWEWA